MAAKNSVYKQQGWWVSNSNCNLLVLQYGISGHPYDPRPEAEVPEEDSSARETEEVEDGRHGVLPRAEEDEEAGSRRQRMGAEEVVDVARQKATRHPTPPHQ